MVFVDSCSYDVVLRSQKKKKPYQESHIFRMSITTHISLL